MADHPRTVGVFPLPHVVLFPEVSLPLHIFEPRYRALLRDALAGDGRIAMAVLKPGYEEDYEGCPDVYPTACVGRIVEHEALPDGRSDLILRGEAVVRIERFVSDAPYRSANVRPLSEGHCFADAPGVEERCRELHDLLDRACPGCVEALRSRWPRDFDEECSVELLHTVAMHLPVNLERKLEWLACPGSLERWESMRKTLREMGDLRTLRRRILRRYEDLAPEDPTGN